MKWVRAVAGGEATARISFFYSHEKPSDTGGTTEHAREQPRTTENQQDKQSRKDRRNDKNKQSQKHRQKHTSQTPAKNDASGFEQHLSRLKGEGKIACKMRGGNSDYRNYSLGKVPKYMLLKGINRACINRLRVMHGVDHII